jgi:hypothetical protein
MIIIGYLLTWLTLSEFQNGHLQTIKPKKTSSCSAQEAGGLRTRRTQEAAPVWGRRPKSLLEISWCKCTFKGWRSSRLMFVGNGSKQTDHCSIRIQTARTGVGFFLLQLCVPPVPPAYLMKQFILRVALPPQFSDPLAFTSECTFVTQLCFINLLDSWHQSFAIIYPIFSFFLWCNNYLHNYLFNVCIP